MSEQIEQAESTSLSSSSSQPLSTSSSERPAGGLVMRGAGDVAACEGDSCGIPTSSVTEEPTTAG
ncbi:hypothetical protein FB566_2823 [Stackebrandtia endophytica]|uniref:Uncharacterized protein n=1 Tax=Stackebrandtia endophytica TaxID=1496996 RepID=A0A543AXH4_9ACTN|nr:hypothetical protein [Stackebrandtia endophytica]TQL77267.1 hypothetical protein FB566_2823 [Stackebrandtia endophytica]